MPHCNVCAKEGEGEEVYSSHNRAQYSKCAYHPRHPKELRKPRRVDDSDDDVDLPADLAEKFSSPDSRRGTPRSGLRSAARPEVERVEKELHPDTTSETDLLREMFAGKLVKDDVVQILSLRIVAEDDEKKEKKLSKALKCANDWSPPEKDVDTTTDQSDASKDLEDLQRKRGKLVGTLAHCYKHVMHELHVNKRGMFKELYEDSETGKTVVKSSANDDISDYHILHLVLLDFIYIAVAYDYLRDVEGRALHRWSSKRGYLNKPCVLVYRTIQRLLALVDAAPSENDLCELISKESTAIFHEETETWSASSGKPSDVDDKSAGLPPGQGVRKTLKHGDSSLAVRYPKSNICWWWTNGKACEDLDANGRCKWFDKHGKCGKSIAGPPDATTGAATTKKCTGTHRAVDCPN